MSYVRLRKLQEAMPWCFCSWSVKRKFSYVPVFSPQQHSDARRKGNLDASSLRIVPIALCHLRRVSLLLWKHFLFSTSGLSHRYVCSTRVVAATAAVRQHVGESLYVGSDSAHEKPHDETTPHEDARVIQGLDDKVNNEEDDDQEAAMEAYEELLLSMNEGSSAPDSLPPTRITATAKIAQDTSLEKTFSAIVAQARALLPLDGLPVRLTDITPLLDVEVISKLSEGGSVLSFLQSFPDVFTLSTLENEGVPGSALSASRGRRWYVSRTKFEKPTSAATQGLANATCELGMAPTDLVKLYADEELRLLTRSNSLTRVIHLEKVQQAAAPVSSMKSSNCERRCRLQPVTTRNTEYSPLETLDWCLLATALPSSKAVPLLKVIQELAPENFLRAVRLSGKGLIRLFHEQYKVAHQHVSLSYDNSLIARKGVLDDAATWAPDKEGPQPEKAANSEEDSWVGDLILDEEAEALVTNTSSVDEEDVTIEIDQHDMSWGGATETHWPSIFYNGLSITNEKASSASSSGRSKKSKKCPPRSKALTTESSTPRTTLIASGESVTIPANAPSRSEKSKKKATSTPSSDKQSEEVLFKKSQQLQTIHTEMAIQRGWRTPLEMLDFFVECVPTFFVPVTELVPTDILAKVLGPRITMSRVVKVYPYFFEYNKDNNHARLSPTLQHPRQGHANVYYSKWDPLRSSETRDGVCGVVSRSTTRFSGLNLQSSAETTAFPVLKPVIRSTYSSPTQSAIAKRAQNAVTTTEENALCSLPTLHGNFRSSIFSVVRSLDLPQSIHTLLKVINGLPYERYLSLTEAAARTGSTNTELERVFEAQDDVFADIKQKHHLFLTILNSKNNGERMVRLRPYWLAPNSLGELSADDLPSELAGALRPIWMSMDKFLSKIPKHIQTELVQRVAHAETDASKVLGGEQDGTDDQREFVRCLRLAGRCCWVNDDGTRVRRYTANADLDDFLHISIELLSHFASHIAEPVDVILDRASETLSLLSDSEDRKQGESGITALCRYATQSRRREFIGFLQNHKKRLEVISPCDSQPFSIFRKTSLVSFASFGGRDGGK